MIMECNDDDECISKLNTNALVGDSQTMSQNIASNEISLTASYDKPFILGYSKFNIKLKADKLEDNTEILITRIRVLEQDRSKTTILSEKDINQFIYAIDTKINEDFILEVDRNNTATEEFLEFEKDINMEIFYKTYDLASGESTKQRSSSFSKSLKYPLKMIIPPTSECNQDECNDGNECTQDACTIINGYDYCVHEYLPQSCCGNKQCDSGENRCNCPVDCGMCGNKYGDFLEYICNRQQECILSIKDNYPEDISKVFKSSSTPFKLETHIYYEQPFEVDGHFKIDIEMLIADKDITDAIIRSIQITVAEDKILGELPLNMPLMSIGEKKSFDLKPSMLDMTEKEISINPRIVVNFRYTDNDRIIVKSESILLGKVYFVDLD